MHGLSLAKLITPLKPHLLPDVATCCRVPILGTQVPVSSYSSTVGYDIFSNHKWGMPTGIGANTRVIMIASIPTVTWQDWLVGSGMIAPDAYSLDSKIDDGIASTGVLRGFDAMYPGGNTANPSAGNPYTNCLNGTLYTSNVNSGCLLEYNMED